MTAKRPSSLRLRPTAVRPLPARAGRCSPTAYRPFTVAVPQGPRTGLQAFAVGLIGVGTMLLMAHQIADALRE